MYKNVEYNKKNIQKPKRNKNNIIPNPTSKKRFIPNLYNLKVVIEPKPDGFDLANLDGHISYEDIPFFVVKRGYMKTIQNMVNDIIDAKLYSYETLKDHPQGPSENTISRKHIVRKIFLNESNYSEWKEFCSILDSYSKGRIGISPLYKDLAYYKSNNPNKMVDVIYGINAEIITFYPFGTDEQFEMDTSYVIIPKHLTLTLFGIFNKLAEENNVNIHQIAAIRYLQRVIGVSSFYLE